MEEKNIKMLTVDAYLQKHMKTYSFIHKYESNFREITNYKKNFTVDSKKKERNIR